MFAFGNPEDLARLMMDACSASDGPGVPDMPIDEMTEDELRILLAYTFMAVRSANMEGADDDTMAVLVEWYDQAFLATAEASEAFVDLFRRGGVQVPFGPRDRDKYFDLLGLSES